MLPIVLNGVVETVKLVNALTTPWRTNQGGESAKSGTRGLRRWANRTCFLDFQAALGPCAKVERPVLLIGERGTGKELAAARVHFLSRRWGGPFVKLNCAALSRRPCWRANCSGTNWARSPGRRAAGSGRFEAANGGTLFLDEIGQMPMPVQEKILRVVEYGSFERVGSSESVHVDVRLVGATNADLPAMVAAGEFKADLLDRLSFEVMIVPPLRERGARRHRPVRPAFCHADGGGTGAGKRARVHRPGADRCATTPGPGTCAR